MAMILEDSYHAFFYYKCNSLDINQFLPNKISYTSEIQHFKFR